MKISRHELIDTLLQIMDRSSNAVQKFKNLSPEELNYKEASGRWSILECIEHLNLYGDYYLPEIEKEILKKGPDPKAELFKSGLLGNYFANLMQIRNGKITKMKSPADKNPINSSLSVTTLDRFLKQQDRLKSLLL
jgi:hypothetical protein